MAQIIPVPLPLMGEGVHEATVVRWLKKVGDQIEKNEALLEVSTDKVDSEIAAPEAGYLIAILSEEGSCVAVNKVMAYIAESPSQTLPSDLKQESQSFDPSNNVEEQRVKNQEVDLFLSEKSLLSKERKLAGRIKSSPIVRKKAEELGLDLSLVAGSGLNGRVVLEDLNRYDSHLHLKTFKYS